MAVEADAVAVVGVDLVELAGTRIAAATLALALARRSDDAAAAGAIGQHADQRSEQRHRAARRAHRERDLGLGRVEHLVLLSLMTALAATAGSLGALVAWRQPGQEAYLELLDTHLRGR